MDCDISPASRISSRGFQYESCHILDTTYPSTYVLCMSFAAVLPQLIRGNGVPTVATRSTLIIYASLNVRILDHPRDSLAAMQVDIGHKASNRHAKTGFLFCTWQIGNFPQKDIAKRGNAPSLTGFHHSPISYPECFRGEITLRVFFVATFSNCSSTKFKSCVSR